MMEGNSVTLKRRDGGKIEGVLLSMDETGALIHECWGFNNKRTFTPAAQIDEIEDHGRPVR